MQAFVQPLGYVGVSRDCLHSIFTVSAVLLMQQVKTKRKVGRPIAYQGDPDSPDLDPEQRQIILRRIANRR